MPVRSRVKFVDRGAQELSELCKTLGFGAASSRNAVRLFEQLLLPWGTRSIGAAPAFPSDIGDDHSPYEFSVALDGAEPEVRVLVEAQGEPPSLANNQAAARAINSILQGEGAHFENLNRVSDLFLPDQPEGCFSLWHSICFRPSRPPSFKVYLNPRVRGEARADAIVEEALGRLGFGRAFRDLRGIGGHRGTARDVLAFFSLDLARAGARVKVYYRHYDSTAEELERSFSLARTSQPGDVTYFCRAMADREGRFSAKPVGSCFSYVDGDQERPSHATLHFPVASYVDNDAIVSARVERWLVKQGLSVTDYLRAVSAIADRPLSAGPGLQSYVSFRREARGLRATVYLSPQLYWDAVPDALSRYQRPSSGVRARVASPEESDLKVSGSGRAR